MKSPLDKCSLVMSGKKVFTESQSKFTQGTHRLAGIFGEETAIIFRKSHVQNPVHGLNYPQS